MNMSMAVSPEKSMPMHVVQAAEDKCDCCRQARENRAFSGCFFTALSPALLSLRHPITQLLGTDCTRFQISPTPNSPLFRPPFT